MAGSTQKQKVGAAAQIQVVYVNPYTLKIVGNINNPERFNLWAKKLHSRLLQNKNWRWVIELAASCLVVMLLTGIYLGWPRKNKKILPQASANSRVSWAQWHNFIGLSFSIISFIILITGLTWSEYAGRQIRAMRDATGQAPPSAPPGLKSDLQQSSTPLSWQSIWAATRARVPDIAVQLTPPQKPDGIWRAVNFDRSQPKKRFELALDAYSAQTLYYAGWDQQTTFSKATAVGIPFHRGELGWWNQTLLLLFGLGLLFSLLSGWIVFFKRRASKHWGPPHLLPGAWRSIPTSAWLVATSLCIAMPLLTLPALIVIGIELLYSKGVFNLE